MWNKSNEVITNPFITGIICFSYSHSMGTGHSSPISPQLLLLWFSGALQKKKATQEQKVGRLAGTEQLLELKVEWRAQQSAILNTFHTKPSFWCHQTISPVYPLCVSLEHSGIRKGWRHQKIWKCPGKQKVIGECRCSVRKQAQVVCSDFYWKFTSLSKNEYFLGWVGFLLDSSFLLYVDYSNFGIEYH